MTRVSCPSSFNASGKAPATSATLLVLAKGNTSEARNKTLMDLRIKVPDIETPGQKSTTLTFYWIKS